MQKKVVKHVINENELKIDIPDGCQCGFGNFYFWGTRMFGISELEIRCMRCGKKIQHVTLAGARKSAKRG